MAHRGVYLRLRHCRRLIAAAFAALIALASSSCSGISGGAQPYVEPSAFPLRISAEWLRSQPGGIDLGEFSFHLLDENARAVSDWQGLSIEPEVQTGSSGPATLKGFTLSARTSPPDDLYLYVAYPGSRYALEYAEPDSLRAADYLYLGIAQRLPDTAIFGMARLAPGRGSRAEAGPLLHLRFAPGTERSFRRVSDVNTDPGSAPQLSLGQQGAGSVALQWTEHNVGDYNNNSQIEIADITPVGIYFGQQAANASDPQAVALVDGDSNGEINVADLTPIGRNFGRYIQGYSVYRAVGASPAEDDFAALGQPSVERQPVLDAASLSERKHALEFSYDAATQVGENHFFVRAWSGDSGSTTEGPASNTVSLSVQPGDSAPSWVTTIGITQTIGLAEAIQIRFGQAKDPEGAAVTYILRYADAEQGSLSGPGTQSIELPEAGLGSGPPYSYIVSGLIQGHSYLFNLQARDETGHRSSNPEVVSGSVPAVGLSTDPWPGWRGGNQRSGANPLGSAREPLVSNWTSPINPPLTKATYDLVVSSEGWVGLRNDDPKILRYSVADGSSLASSELLNAGHFLGLSVDGALVCTPSDDGAQLWDSSSNQLSSFGTGETIASLLLKDFLFVQTTDSVSAYSSADGHLLWTLDQNCNDSGSRSLPCASDGSSLYAAEGTAHYRRLDLPQCINPQDLIAGNLGHASITLDETGGAAFVVDLLGDMTAFGSQNFSLPFDSDAPPTVCLVRHSSPAMLVGYFEEAANDFDLRAYDADTGAKLWDGDELGLPESDFVAVTAGTDRLFVTGGEQLYVLDFFGRLRQTIPLGAPALSEAVPVGSQVFVLTPGGLRSYGLAGSDGPPVWQGVSAKPGGGISSLADAGGGMLDVGWDYAVDDHALPVYYSIYYSADEAPEFDAPFTHTTVVSDIPHSGLTHSYQLGPLDTSRRWYVGVRASDRPWNDNPNTDTNTNWLALSPGWQREELLLGSNLPAGQVYFMRGIADPAGGLHLLYNDELTTRLTHVFGSSGSWNSESSGLSVWPSIAFEPAWDAGTDELTIGRTDGSSVSVLRRTGADSWSSTAMGNTLPVVNPMLSLAYPESGSNEAALAYTELINPALPPDEDYYICLTQSGTWQPAVELDPLNFSGRDLDMLINPLDSTDPWTLMQRGYGYTPNRYTPQAGELTFARSDGAGGWQIDTVDAGVNAPESDCGKRCQLLRSGPAADPVLHAAYLDLNSSADAPLGELRYARYAGGSWSSEQVEQFDLSYQTTPANLQYTWGELGFALDAGEPVITTLVRSSSGASATDPHYIRVWTFTRSGPGNWTRSVLTEDELVFPRDREPCVMLESGGTLHIFYASNQDDLNPEADKIVHLWRAP